MSKSRLYLLLAIVGFIAPNILVFMESIETRNILLYSNPLATIEGMFANRISTIFMIDLFFTVVVFFIWTYLDGKKYGNKNLEQVWFLTLLLGLAGGFPFYLYLKEKALVATDRRKCEN
ncbi:DUF2834 domain-containing protein [Muriicola sp. Z0-33]|uniref:DUF2834 domain-containing protein n=1 Tax=Muriicola sp. Z0-33 TaxID=2816957 RepID=UPI0022378EA5|nr:DUF2834 domain-containing protein [Muriicola sp. Z0-33]MCW5518137.1 DUF2834 domain-containing protein [Muriicola sp. Z0-33]